MALDVDEKQIQDMAISRDHSVLPSSFPCRLASRLISKHFNPINSETKAENALDHSLANSLGPFSLQLKKDIYFP